MHRQTRVQSCVVSQCWQLTGRISLLPILVKLLRFITAFSGAAPAPHVSSGMERRDLCCPQIYKRATSPLTT